MEVINGVDEDVQDVVEQILDNREFLIEVLRFLENPYLFFLNRASHHEDLESGFLLIQGFNLFLVKVDISVEKVHLSD